MSALFTVEAKGRAAKFIKSLNPKKKERVTEIISMLKGNPVPVGQLDIVKLKGYDGMYRIRIGDVRIVYEVFWNQGRILLHYAGPRAKAYDNV